MKTTDPQTGEVLEWTTFYAPDGTPVQYVWDDIDAFDDFPYRCPTGQCVANAQECFMWSQTRPLCNNRGYCRADASCECYPGCEARPPARS